MTTPTPFDYASHERRMKLRAEGWRFCHNRSARKHRRQGHDVHYFGDGQYRWRPRCGIWLLTSALTRHEPPQQEEKHDA